MLLGDACSNARRGGLSRSPVWQRSFNLILSHGGQRAKGGDFRKAINNANGEAGG